MDDLISRQAAIDVCDYAIDLWHGQLGEGIVIAVKKKIEELPSAQPEKVKCKKCRYVYYDKEFDNYWCNRMSDPFKVEEEGYCKWGK